MHCGIKSEKSALNFFSDFFFDSLFQRIEGMEKNVKKSLKKSRPLCHLARFPFIAPYS